MVADKPVLSSLKPTDFHVVVKDGHKRQTGI